MKKQIITTVAVACIVWLGLSGCWKPEGVRTEAGNRTYNVVVIDGCEYIECDYGLLDQRVYSLTHKGNCKNPIHVYAQKP